MPLLFASVEAEADGMNLAGMSRQYDELLRSDGIPNAYGIVPRRRGDAASVGAKGSVIDQIQMPSKNPKFLTRRRVPYPRGFVC